MEEQWPSPGAVSVQQPKPVQPTPVIDDQFESVSPLKLDKVAYIRVKIVPPTISNVVGVKGCPQWTRTALKIPKPTIAAMMSRRYPVTLTPKGCGSSLSSSLLQLSSLEAAPGDREVKGDLNLVGKSESDVGMNCMMEEDDESVLGTL